MGCQCAKSNEQSNLDLTTAPEKNKQEVEYKIPESKAADPNQVLILFIFRV